MLIEWAQTLIAGSAVFLGATYVIGGLIVNLNLTRRGVVEFQILKVKYLVVGLVFLLHVVGAFSFAVLPAIGLLLIPPNILLLETINLISVISACSLIVIWGRLPSSSPSRLTGWNYWFVASIMGALFPMLVLARQLIAFNLEIDWLLFSIQALLTAALTFLAQVYHYSAFYYGRPSSLGALDPIGVGIPTRVKLVCLPEGAKVLAGLDISTNEQHVSQDLFLIDETDRHYLLAFERIPGQQGNDRTVKIDKDLVKAMLFIPDHMRKTGAKRSLLADGIRLGRRKNKESANPR